MAGMEPRELPKTSSFKLNKVVFCPYGPFKECIDSTQVQSSSSEGISSTTSYIIYGTKQES